MQRRKLNQIASVLKRKSNSSIRGLISTNKYLIKFNNLSIPDGQFNQKKKSAHRDLQTMRTLP